jgi:hypothetical protein
MTYFIGLHKRGKVPTARFPVHSRLKQEPFVSITDICAFCHWQTGSAEFAVYSPVLSIYFIYEIATNTIASAKNLNV